MCARHSWTKRDTNGAEVIFPQLIRLNIQALRSMILALVRCYHDIEALNSRLVTLMHRQFPPEQLRVS